MGRLLYGCRPVRHRFAARDCHEHDFAAILHGFESHADLETQEKRASWKERGKRPSVSVHPFRFGTKGAAGKQKAVTGSKPSETGKYRFALLGIVPGSSNPGKELRPT
jgi:hypothetical protein